MDVKFDKIAGILREDDSQSLTSNQEARLTNLEDTYELIQIWESVTTNSGTLTIPTNATIEENRYENGIDAICTQIQGVPIDEVAKTSTNVPITVSLSANGDYTLSDTPSAYPVAIIYFISIKKKYVSNVSLNQIIDRFDIANNPFDQELNTTNDVDFNSATVNIVDNDPKSVVNKEYADNISRSIIYKAAVLNILNTPPVTPTLGDRYIVGTSPTDDFVGHANDIATFTTIWEFETPLNSWTTLNTTNNNQYNFNGTSWINIGEVSSEHNSLNNIYGNSQGYHLSNTTYNLVSTYTNTDSDISSAVLLKHTHTNYSILNSIDATKVSNWDSSYTHTLDNTIHITTEFKQEIVDHLASTVIHVTADNKLDWNTTKSNIDSHLIATNPHNITKTTISLGNVDNTSDIDKPISALTQTALNSKSDTSHNHSGTYEPVDTTILRTTDIIDNLTSTSNTDTLSANQGKVLNDSKVNKIIGKDLSTNDLTNELKSNYDTAYSNTHGVNDPNTSHYTKEESDGKYVDISTDQSINGSKTFNNARAENIPDINDADSNKFATLENVKNSTGGIVNLLISDTNFN